MILSLSMIQSFADKETKQVYEREVPRGFSGELAKRARDKLVLLDLADELDELRIPPGNRLEKLRGNREKQHSIRINAQWRVCFEWRGQDAHEVEIVDYHK